MKPNFTITFGVRHTILQTPYETSGQQVTPTMDTHTWFLQREAAAQKGQIYEPDLYFSPAGPSTASRDSGRNRRTTLRRDSPLPTHPIPRPHSNRSRHLLRPLRRSAREYL